MFDVILWKINICYCWQVFGEPFFRNTDDAGPILESKGMGPIFQKKKKGGTKKGKGRWEDDCDEKGKMIVCDYCIQ